MKKYNISKEFFPYSYMKTPVMPPKLAGWMGSLMRPPRWIWRDKAVSVKAETITGYGGGEIEVLILAPREIKEPASALVYLDHSPAIRQKKETPIAEYLVFTRLCS